MGGFGHTRRRAWHLTVASLASLVALWLGGLGWFITGVLAESRDETSVTDAIVVLTGGSLRVQSGVFLLTAGMAKTLFISGVHQGVDVSEILHQGNSSSEALAPHIILGHAASDTIGNAAETALFMHEAGYRSLRLVTSSYHMQRALLEFARAMPEIKIIPHPVLPERVKQEGWWTSPGLLELIISEYNKYLLALARPLLPGMPA